MRLPRPWTTAARALLIPAALALGAVGRAEPQSLAGPCQVDPFFIVGFGTSNAALRIAGAPATRTPAACSFTVISPNDQRFQTAALLTAPPAHGVATAALVAGGTSVAITYAPAPGYVGPDRFTTTIEPDDRAVIVNVTVGPATP